MKKALSQVVWVNPCFLHYRVPVYCHLDRMLENGLTVIYSGKRTLPEVDQSLRITLGPRAVALFNESLYQTGSGNEDFANRGILLPYQPGLIRAIQQARPQLIISENFLHWTPAALWYKLSQHIPLAIYYERTAHTDRNASWLQVFYRKLISKKLDALCCNGKLSCEYALTHLKIPLHKIFTGGMAADVDYIQSNANQMHPHQIEGLRKELGLRSPVFLCAGRLIPLKGLLQLLEGWKIFRLKNPGQQASLLLVGEGPQRTTLEQRIREENIPDVSFTGLVDYRRMTLYYCISDVFISASLEDNWSLVVAEAMACGKPVLCSRFNGCWPELIVEDHNGWVFDPYDSMQLADLLARSAQEPEKLRAMGEASLEIIKMFTPETAAQSIYTACQITWDRHLSH